MDTQDPTPIDYEHIIKKLISWTMITHPLVSGTTHPEMLSYIPSCEYDIRQVYNPTEVSTEEIIDAFYKDLISITL